MARHWGVFPVKVTISQVIEVTQIRILQRKQAVHRAEKGQEVAEHFPLRPEANSRHGFIPRDAPDRLVQLVPRRREREAVAGVVWSPGFLALIDTIPSRLERGSLLLDPLAQCP